MSKELKAFIGICCNTNQNYPDFTKQRKIVETALKKLEKIETTTPSVLREDISKKLQALEIIKDIVPISFRYDAVEKSYYIVINNIGYECSKEEYDLLKEVLL